MGTEKKKASTWTQQHQLLERFWTRLDWAFLLLWASSPYELLKRCWCSLLQKRVDAVHDVRTLLLQILLQSLGLFAFLMLHPTTSVAYWSANRSVYYVPAESFTSFQYFPHKEVTELSQSWRVLQSFVTFLWLAHRGGYEVLKDQKFRLDTS